mmetsp:Transcript_48370/g.121766  ORF Transcript_48370/g.121766 Transcript_48370/m.121766 type:complete len:148 (-) Transcript_48370:21-464(-)
MKSWSFFVCACLLCVAFVPSCTSFTCAVDCLLPSGAYRGCGKKARIIDVASCDECTLDNQRVRDVCLGVTLTLRGNTCQHPCDGVCHCTDSRFHPFPGQCGVESCGGCDCIASCPAGKATCQSAISEQSNFNTMALPNRHPELPTGP